MTNDRPRQVQKQPKTNGQTDLETGLGKDKREKTIPGHTR